MSHDPGVFDRDFDNPYEAPKAGKAPGDSPYPPGQGYTGYAGFWVRFVALFIDNIILGLVGLALTMVFGALLIATSRGSESSGVTIALQIVMQLISISINVAYFAGMESSASQATVGKMAMGLKVTDVYGRRLTFGRAAGRWAGKILSSLILGIGYLMAAFDGRKQALHDKMAGTLVMKTR